MLSSMTDADTVAKYDREDVTNLKVPALHGQATAQSQKTVAQLNASIPLSILLCFDTANLYVQLVPIAVIIYCPGLSSYY